MPEGSAQEIVRELFDRIGDGQFEVIDELMAVDMVNHAAGPQGRDGWKRIGEIIRTDLGDGQVL